MKSFKQFSVFLFALFLSLAFVSPLQTEAASKMKLNKTKTTISVGKSTTLKVKNTKKKVRWSTSSKKVAIVTSKGKVTGKKAGTATITAKVGTKKLTCKVTVKPALSKTTITLYPGDTAKLTVKGTKKKVTWTSSAKSIAKVSKGTVTGVKPGVATIKAKVSSYTLKCKVIVRPTTDYVAPSYDKLKEAILASSYVHTDGNKALMMEEVVSQNTEDGTEVQGKVGLYAIYEEATGCFRFELSMDALDSNILTTFTLNPSTVCNDSQPVSFCCKIIDTESGTTYHLSGTSQIDIATYTMESSSFSFQFDNAESMTEDELVLAQMLPDMYALLAITGCDAMITEKTGITFNDLGFVALSYE